MKHRRFAIVLILEAIFCTAFSLFENMVPDMFSTFMAFPFEQIAYGLRLLSLSGSAGNAIAIILYIVVSLIPLLFLLRKNRHWEDLFLVLLSIQLFLSLYCMINPGLISRQLIVPLGAQFEKVMLGSMFYSFLTAYLVLRFVRSFFLADRIKLVKYLNVLLWGLCFVLIYTVFSAGLSGLLQSFTALRESNKGNEHLLGISYIFLTLRYLLDALPYLLDILIVFAVQDLIRAEQNSEGAVCAANKLSKYCGVSLILIVVSTTIYHILQLLFLKQIHQSSVTVELPLFSLLFVLAVLWMAQYVKENKKLKDDNDLFI